MARGEQYSRPGQTQNVAAAPIPDPVKRIKGYWDDQIKKAQKAQNPWKEAEERIRRHAMGDFSDQFLEAGGEADAEAATPQDTASFSLVHSTNKTITPYLYFKNPTIRARSVRPENEGLAKCIEAFGAYLHREQPYKAVTKSTVRFADLFGIGCVATEWDRVRGLPTRRRVRMRNILVNPDATDDMRSVTWVAERFMEPIRKVKANPNIRHKEHIRPSHETGQYERTTSRADQMRSELYELAAGWRIWIRGEHPGLVYARDPKDEKGQPEPEIGEVKNRVIEIYDGSPWIHRDSAWPVQFDHDQFPFTFIRFNSQDGDFWGMSEYAITKGLQSFMNWGWTFTLRRARKACTDKILHDSGLSDDVVERLTNGEDLAAIPVNAEHLQAIERALHVVKFDKIEPELLHLLDRVKATYDEIIGITGSVRGGLPASGSRSATQAEIEDERAQNRINDRLDDVETFASALVRKDMQMAAQLIPTFDQFKVTQDVKFGPDFQPLPDDTPDEMVAAKFTKGQRIDESNPALAVLGPLGGVTTDQRGMAYFVGPQLGQFWRDDLTIEEVRREIQLEIEHGTTRKLNKTQQIQEYQQLLMNLAPVYMNLQMGHKVANAVNLYIRSFENPKAEEALAFNDQEIQMLSGQLAQAMAQNVNAQRDGEPAPPGANGRAASQGQMQRLLAQQLGARG